MFIRDESGIVADWLIKIVIGLAVFGVIAYDAGSILVNHFTLDSSSDDIAIAVSRDVDAASGSNQFTPDEIWRLASSYVGDEEDGVAEARVSKVGTFVDDAGIVHIRLRRTADTLIVRRIGAIKDWARATADGQAGT